MKIPQTFEQGMHIGELHEDHRNWILELDFYKKEIVFFQHLLEDFARNQKTNAQNAAIEQFQNKLILQNEQADIMLHYVHEQETKLQNFIKTHESNIEFITFKDHKTARDKMSMHRKLYAAMKQEFYHGITLK
ncbi:MAG: hypothetical protein HYZ14_19270 [Bacteroidetes bacterium]|nr:hypothetical protein [Bacteroidota bacterium]